LPYFSSFDATIPFLSPSIGQVSAFDIIFFRAACHLSCTS